MCVRERERERERERGDVCLYCAHVCVCLCGQTASGCCCVDVITGGAEHSHQHRKTHLGTRCAADRSVMESF